ncbi:MAG: transglycosylase domain-containing protein [Saprospiraceae bacterium]|nr:transglycosylase domain-containing protein [Saprospiraceae bacterium]
MAFDLNRMKLLVVAYYKDVIVGGVLFSVCWVLLYNWVAPPLTVQMITRSILDEGSLKYTYTPYAKISPYVKVCAMASEDQNLPFHSGMDIAAIQKAMHVNRKDARFSVPVPSHSKWQKTYFCFRSARISEKLWNCILLFGSKPFGLRKKYWRCT